MALVTFQDLPSTSTPINATNLNNNFNECCNKSAITVSLSADSTISITTAYGVSRVALNATNAESDARNIFDFSNNVITVNKTGYYLISSKVMAKSQDTQQSIIAAIRRYRPSNDTTVTLTETYMAVSRAANYTVSLTPVVVSLTNGDKISLVVGGSRTGDINVNGATNGRYTMLTVQEL